MEKDKYITLDNAISTVALIFQTHLKDKNELNLYNFNRHNKAHRTILETAAIVKKVTQVKLTINCGLKDYIFLKRKYNNLVDFNWTKKREGIDFDKLDFQIGQMYYPQVLNDAYEEYYKR